MFPSPLWIAGKVDAVTVTISWKEPLVVVDAFWVSVTAAPSDTSPTSTIPFYKILFI